MNLEGSLDAFGLPDVVTLLATTGKTGALGVRRNGPDGAVEGVLWFHEGRLGSASSDRGRASLVRRLVGSGAVDDAALRSAVSRAADGSGLARALLDAGSVDPELLAQAAADQTVDAVFDVLRWADGEFGFDQSATDHDDVGLRLDPGAVLAEASARMEHWARLEAIVPSADSVLSVPVVLAEDPVLTRDEWALLALVDGRRRVHDLVELTGCGHFAVMTMLAGLVQRGLVLVHDAATLDHVGVVERRLGLLAGVESAPAAEPVAAPAAAPRIALDPPAGPGSLGMSAAAALAAARAAQGHAPAAPPVTTRVARQSEVVPARPEPFQPERRPEHPEPAYAGHSTPVLAGSVSAAVVEGATARTLSDPIVATSAESAIERDPSVNRSLLLRLIAGVRGL